MAKIVLDTVTGGYDLSVINNNFDKIETELQNKVLYRNNPVGEPNTLETDLDANGKRIYNLPEPLLDSQAARLQDVQNAIAGGAANLIPFTPYGHVAGNNVQAAVQELIDDTTNNGVALPAFLKDSNTIVVDNISALKAIDKTKFTKAQVLGYYTKGDGGGGVYWFDPSDTASADNGGTVIVATDGGRWKLLMNDVLSVKQFGAKGDGTTDNTSAIQAAVTAAATGFAVDWFNSTDPAAGIRKVIFPTSQYKIAGKVLVPQGVIIDFQNSTLIGTGYTVSDNIMFETGYFNAGSLVTNIGAAAGVGRCVYTQFLNGRVKNCKIAFNVYQFAEGSRIEGMSFYNCRQNIVADWSFYGTFKECTSRGTAGGATEAAYEFLRYVNVEGIDKLTSVDRVLGFHIGGEINGTALRNITAENGTNGLKIDAGSQAGSKCGPLHIGQGCYFENMTGNAIDMSDAAHTKVAVTIDDAFFNTCGTGIVAAAFAGRIGAQNRFLSTTNPVYIAPTDMASYGVIEINGGASAAALSGNGTPALPSGYTVGPKCKVVYPVLTYDAGTGAPTTKLNYTNGLIELPYAGDSGYVPNGVPYCTHQKTAGTNFSVLIDTRIAFNEYALGVFKIKVTDNDGVWTFTGRFYGDTVFLDGTSHGAKTVAVSNFGGYIRLTLATFNHPSETYGIEGVVRHM